MTKSEYDKRFDEATKEFLELFNTSGYEERFIKHFNECRDEKGNIMLDKLVAFLINESAFEARDYLYILMQKFLDIKE